ncbi:MAG: integrin alpha [Planctomycetota bacterium]
MRPLLPSRSFHRSSSRLSASGRALLALALPLAPAHAQVWESSPLAEATLGPGVGFVVDSVGDLDGDGHRDGLISSISDGGNRGRVYAVSSATGAVVHSVGGATPGDNLGHSVAGLDDLDGDGVDDFAGGAPAGQTGRAGSVTVFSGASGAALWTADGETAGDSFGWVVSRAGDVNGDGVGDVAVCAPGFDAPSANDVGRAYVLSGVDGAQLRTFTGTTPISFFGASCGAAGDTNGDGVEDLVVCTLRGGANGRGEATLFSGADGSELWRVSAPNGSTQYGNYFSGLAGDTNADGVGDVYVIDYQNQAQRGRLFVYSGVDGALLHSIRGPLGSRWIFGRVKIGDLDGDGHDDLMTCSSLNDVGGIDAGAIYFHSGATGTSLGRFTSDTAGRNMGSDCASVGDVDGDGTEDVFVGVGAITPGVGGAFVLPTGTAPPVLHCEGTVNSTGDAGEIGYSGSLELSTSTFAFSVQGLPASQLTVVFGGADTASTPLGDGTLCIGGALARVATLTTNGSGTGLATPLLPTSGPASIFAGAHWYAQAWYRDPAAGGFGANLTSAMRIRFR